MTYTSLKIDANMLCIGIISTFNNYCISISFFTSVMIEVCDIHAVWKWCDRI